MEFSQHDSNEDCECSLPVKPKYVKGDAGSRGADGWSPVLSIVADGSKRVCQLTDWTGGTGTKPTAFLGYYVGADGYTSSLSLAINLAIPVPTGPTPSIEIEPFVADGYIMVSDAAGSWKVLIAEISTGVFQGPGNGGYPTIESFESDGYIMMSNFTGSWKVLIAL